MNRLIALHASGFCENLLTALLYSLWQGLVIAGLLLLFLKSKAAKDANVRYIAGLIALTVIVLCGLFTWAVLDYEPFPVSETLTSNSPSEMTTSFSDQIESNKESNLTREATLETDKYGEGFTESNWQVWAICVWLIGAVVMLLRAFCLVVGGNRLRRQCRPLEDEHILAIVEQLCKSIGIARQIRTVVSERISVPGVIGCIWPILLLPVSMVSGIPTDEIKAVLAHELAHIRRYDYLVNFCQMIIEAFLFFNPAVWWISRQIRIEREACCDAAGVAITGQRARYAEVLACWAQKLKSTTVAAPAAVTGFSDENQNGSILERIKRIMIAGHSPRVKFSWQVATATLIVSLGLLVVLWQGTNMAVVLAGRILSPQERIERIKQISKDYGFEDGQYDEKDNVHISGIIRTWDGKPLPKHPKAMVHSQRSDLGSSSSIYISTKGQPEGRGRFDMKVTYGSMFIVASADGYGPAFAGPFGPEPGGKIEGIELVLPEGFPTRIQVLDESGRPIEGAQITGGYICPGSGSYQHSIKLITDQNGIAVHQHAATHKVGLKIEADGFEPESIQEVILKQNKTTVVALRATRPATGVVVSQATGEPIEGAEIRLMMSSSSFGKHSHSENAMYGEPAARTNSSGQFELKQLRADRQYLVLVRAEGYGYKYHYDIKAGDSNIEVILGDEKVIRGTVTGELGKLSKDRDGTPILRYRSIYKLGDNTSLDSRIKCPVIIKDNVGYFEFQDFYGQTVKIHAADKEISLDVENDDLDNVVIELLPENNTMREVVLFFNVLADSPAMQGGVNISYIKEGEKRYKSDRIDVVDSHAGYEVPVPCRFGYKIDYYHGKRPVGYWFRESVPVEVPIGDEPFVIEVPVHPAGAIYGRILKEDGTVAANASASLIVAKTPEVAGNGLNDLNAALQGGGVDRGTFNATPLPLDGKYAIVVHVNNYVCVTKPIKLDKKNQIVEHDIKLSRGITLRGQLLDIDGRPARDEMKLDVSVKCGEHGWSTSRGQIRPDENGWFAFDNVNPDFAGEYMVNVSVRKGYRPVRHKVKNVAKPVIIQLKKGKQLTGVVIDDATGWPIPGAEVYGYCINGGVHQYENLKAEAETNERGEFVFSNMAAKKYRLGVRSGRLVQSQGHVVVTGGQQEDVILRINLSEHSNLKPLKSD